MQPSSRRFLKGTERREAEKKIQESSVKWFLKAVPQLAPGLRHLGAAAAAWRRWRGHAAAADRASKLSVSASQRSASSTQMFLRMCQAASVLIASLNAALRTQRAASQPLLADPLTCLQLAQVRACYSEFASVPCRKLCSIDSVPL